MIYTIACHLFDSMIITFNSMPISYLFDIFVDILQKE